MKSFKVLLLGCLLMLQANVFQSLAFVPEPLIQAIITVESSGQPKAVSKDGCRGLGQIQEATWYWLCQLMGVSWSFDEAFEPQKNLAITRFYLEWLTRYLQKKGRYSLELLLSCYNAGPGTVRKYGWRVPPYPETQHYIVKVQKQLRIFEKENK